MPSLPEDERVLRERRAAAAEIERLRQSGQDYHAYNIIATFINRNPQLYDVRTVSDPV